MKILITGGAGFIGSNLAHWLTDRSDDEIYVADNFSTGTEENLPERVSRVWLDVTDADNVNVVFNIFRPDVCYHFAAYAAEGRSNYIRSFIHQNNTVGAANVINACLNHGTKLIFTSSVAVYSGNQIFTEDVQPNPIDEYGSSKWTTERSIQIAGEQGLDWCIVRPRNVYGKYQSMRDACRNVFGIWMYQIKNNLPMTIYGDGSNKRCFTCVDDILEPLDMAIMNASKEIINLGSPIPYSIKAANEILQQVTGYTNVEHLEERHEVQEAVCRTEKSELLLGYQHKTYLKEGLEKMWAWAKQQPIEERQTPPPLEVNIKAHSSII